MWTLMLGLLLHLAPLEMRSSCQMALIDSIRVLPVILRA